MVNLTHVLEAAFMRVDPKSAKKTVTPKVFFVILGSAFLKAARKTLVKSTLDRLCLFHPRGW